MTRNRNSNRYYRKQAIPPVGGYKNKNIEFTTPETIIRDFIPAIQRIMDIQRLDIYKDVIDRIIGFIKDSRQINYSKKECGVCSNKMVGMVYKLPCCKKDIRLECYIKSHFKCPFCRESARMTLPRPPAEVLYGMIIEQQAQYMMFKMISGMDDMEDSDEE